MTLRTTFDPDRCHSVTGAYRFPWWPQPFRSEVANNSNRVATSFFGLIKGGHCVDKHVLRCDIGRGRKSFSVSRCDIRQCNGVTSEVVTRSLSARCKRGSKKAPIEVRLAEFAFSRHFATLVCYFAINLVIPGTP